MLDRKRARALSDSDSDDTTTIADKRARQELPAAEIPAAFGPFNLTLPIRSAPREMEREGEEEKKDDDDDDDDDEKKDGEEEEEEAEEPLPSDEEEEESDDDSAASITQTIATGTNALPGKGAAIEYQGRMYTGKNTSRVYALLTTERHFGRALPKVLEPRFWPDAGPDPMDWSAALLRQLATFAVACSSEEQFNAALWEAVKERLVVVSPFEDYAVVPRDAKEAMNYLP